MRRRMSGGARLSLWRLRPQRPRARFGPGERLIDLGHERPAVLYVPPHAAFRPAPMVVCLHGARGSGLAHLADLREAADRASMVLLAPSALGSTWSGAGDGSGVDAEAIDRALALALPRLRIDPSRIAIEGFSDGASFGLSLGLANPDLFTRVVAFSPGFVALPRSPPEGVAPPRVLVAHGRHDTVFPLETYGRRVYRELVAAGVYVELREFEGGHAVPRAVAHEALGWISGG